MTGYHYTSYSNWLSIQRDGLLPYNIDNPDVIRYFPSGVEGICLWAERPSGESDLGNIVYQLTTRQNTRIVLLEFYYEEADRLRCGGRLVRLHSEGVIGEWIYDNDQVAYIVTEPIPPENIRLVRDVNLMDLVPPDLGIAVSEEIGIDEHL